MRDPELTEAMRDTGSTVNAMLAAGLAAIVFAASFGAGAFLREPAVGPVLRILAVVPLTGIFEFHTGAMLCRDMQFKTLSILGTARTLIRTGLTVPLAVALAGYSYMGMVYASVASTSLFVIAVNPVARRHIWFRFSLEGWRPMTVFGLRMMSIGGVAGLARRLCEIILGRFLRIGAHALALDRGRGRA